MYSEVACRRFWAKVDVRGPDECWPWLGSPGSHGYGDVRIDGKLLRANRVALEMHTGKPLGKLGALHTCDAPGCCNYNHLFAGTPAQNSKDMVEKGRNAKGGRHGRAKLSDRQAAVIKVLAGCAPRGDVAKLFGVAHRLVARIQRGDTFKGM